MIKLSNIRKTYDGSTYALQGINLDIAKGEIYGIIGKSGAGKSTLIRCINMLEAPTAGEVVVDGLNLTKMADNQLRLERKDIGMIFQHFNLLSSATVYENVAFPLKLSGKSAKEIQDKVLPLLELVGLESKKDQYPAQLSGGQKQRVGIARALANNPKVLLCDEATSALDPQTTKSILDLLKDINQSLQLTIVLITHEMQVIKEICDKVAVIENGKIIEQGPVIDIFSKPQQETTRDFISAIINHDLPEIFQGTEFSPEPINNGHLVLRISFMGHSTEEPIIAGLIRRFDIDISILYGNVDHIKTTPYGTLLLELSGDAEKIQEALSYLQEKQLGIEVIGYVARHDNVAS